MIDDRAQNFQQIRCETPMADVIGCHTITRTLCEILYSCGTQERPAICECVTQFGYPAPIPNVNVTRSFEEACNITNETAAT
jgi:lipase ATG15